MTSDLDAREDELTTWMERLLRRCVLGSITPEDYLAAWRAVLDDAEQLVVDMAPTRPDRARQLLGLIEAIRKKTTDAGIDARMTELTSRTQRDARPFESASTTPTERISAFLAKQDDVERRAVEIADMLPDEAQRLLGSVEALRTFALALAFMLHRGRTAPSRKMLH